jgi:hypothetical protein
MKRPPLARIEAAFADDATQDRLAFSNAAAFLALEAQS